MRPPSAPRAALWLLALAASVPSCGPADPNPGAAASSAEDRPGQGLVILPDPDAPAPDPLDDTPPRPYYHDFGHVPDGEVASYAFRLENRDPVPVGILKVKPGCGCTLSRVRTVDAQGQVVRAPRRSVDGEPLVTVLPGKVAEVELSIDTRLLSVKNLDKTLTTLVTTDSPNSYYLTLETHIFAEKPFNLVPNGLDFGPVPLAGEQAKSCDIVLVPGFDLELGELLAAPPGIRTEIVPDPGAPRPLWRLTAIFTPDVEGPLGPWSGVLRFAVRDGDGELVRELEVPLSATRSPDLVSDPSRLVFRADRDGAAGEVVVSSLLPGSIFRVLAARFVDPAQGERFTASFEPAGTVLGDRCASWRVRLEAPRADAVERLERGTLVLDLDDPQHPEVRVPFVVHPGG